MILSTPAQAQQPIVIKYSHVNTDNTPKGVAALKFKELAEKYLGNKVKVEVFPNSTLFGDAQEMEALLLNDVQIIAPSLSKFERYTDKLQLFDLPFLFKNVDAVTRFQQGKEGQELLNSIRNRGYTGLGYIQNGMKQMSANREIHMPVDAKGLRIRIQPSKVIEAQYQAVGAVPQKLAFSEVYQALQTGVVNGQENSWTSIYTMKFYEVQPYIVESNHGMMSFMVTVSTRWWDKLPPDVREGLARAIKESSAEANNMANKMHQDNKKKIVESGKSQIITLSDKEHDAWQKAMSPVWTKFEKAIGKDLIEAARKANSG
ncbi:MAG: TRAP transporter substrate-binding protein [Xanthobacteraceae bacterium]|uniref:TRAP transporter substrate-binding protein n=1 Tax=Pseudolabrys sp. TaxID=1960880 RepID=UPI003D0BCDDB